MSVMCEHDFHYLKNKAKCNKYQIVKINFVNKRKKGTETEGEGEGKRDRDSEFKSERDEEIYRKRPIKKEETERDSERDRDKNRHGDTCTPSYPPRVGEARALPASSGTDQNTGSPSGCPTQLGPACVCERPPLVAQWAAACDHPCPQCHPLPVTVIQGHQWCLSCLHMHLPSEG